MSTTPINPNDLRDRMTSVLNAAVCDDDITDSEADELERVFEHGLQSLGYM